MRIKTPDGFNVAPHWHPRDENITVLQGTGYLGVGEKFDENAAHELRVGSYAKMPRRIRHFAWMKGETIFQIHGLGPFKVIWVQPAKAPRHGRAAK